MQRLSSKGLHRLIESFPQREGKTNEKKVLIEKAIAITV
jgi:hypothetical protein